MCLNGNVALCSYVEYLFSSTWKSLGGAGGTSWIIILGNVGDVLRMMVGATEPRGAPAAIIHTDATNARNA